MVSFGAYTDGTHTPTVFQSVDGVTFTACVYGTDLDGPSNLAGGQRQRGSQYRATNRLHRHQRYIAVVITTTGATTGALSSASVIAGYPRNAPTM